MEEGLAVEERRPAPCSLGGVSLVPFRTRSRMRHLVACSKFLGTGVNGKSPHPTAAPALAPFSVETFQMI